MFTATHLKAVKSCIDRASLREPACPTSSLGQCLHRTYSNEHVFSAVSLLQKADSSFAWLSNGCKASCAASRTRASFALIDTGATAHVQGLSVQVYILLMLTQANSLMRESAKCRCCLTEGHALLMLELLQCRCLCKEGHGRALLQGLFGHHERGAHLSFLSNACCSGACFASLSSRLADLLHFHALALHAPALKAFAECSVYTSACEARSARLSQDAAVHHRSVNQ